MSYKVYLTDTIGELSYNCAATWRNYLTKLNSASSVTFLNPLRNKEQLYWQEYNSGQLSQRGITARNFYDINRADAVIAVLISSRVSIGTVMEIAWAYAQRKPVIAVTNGSKLYDHVMLNEAISYSVQSIYEAAELAYSLAGCPMPSGIETLLAEPQPEQVQLIGFSGFAGVGKDTAAGLLSKYGWVNVSFADALRELYVQLQPDSTLVPQQLKDQALKQMIAFPNGCTHRQALQRLGTEAVRGIYENIWIDKLAHRIDEYRKLLVRNFYITDVRFANEAEFVRLRKGLLIRIVRQDYAQPLSLHESEQAIVSLPTDVTLVNDGTIADLHEALYNFLKEKGVNLC